MADALNTAAERIAQLRASLAILKANPGMSITANMATGPDGEPISVHDAGANCFCFLGRVARDHAPVAVYEDNDVFHWLDNSFFKSLGEPAGIATGRLITCNDRSENAEKRFWAIEHYIDKLEAKFVRGEDVDIYA